MTDIQQQLAEYTARFNSVLPAFFPHSESAEQRVTQAMQYSVANGGKRLRPFLVYAVAKMFGIDFEQSLPTAVALECLHSYSLIHDDLPAMDNDDLRRGKPTCHKAFDEATAILAGDGLLTYAFELLSRETTHPDPSVRCRLLNALAKNAGAFDGMVAGQMLDLISEQNSSLDTEEIIKHIEEMKTGRLISFACQAGAILGHADPIQSQALYTYSRGIGIAFQIADDILDVSGSEEKMGKTLKKDEAQGKLTFVKLYGLETAKQIAQDYITQAEDALIMFEDKADTLRLLARFIIERDH